MRNMLKRKNKTWPKFFTRYLWSQLLQTPKKIVSQKFSDKGILLCCATLASL